MATHAYLKGMKARRKGYQSETNPYDRNDAPKKHHEWADGWIAEDVIVTTLSPSEDLTNTTAWKQ